MTNATMALAELAEKGADVDVLRQMVQFMAQRLMELDALAYPGCGLKPRDGTRPLKEADAAISELRLRRLSRDSRL